MDTGSPYKVRKGHNPNGNRPKVTKRHSSKIPCMHRSASQAMSGGAVVWKCTSCGEFFDEDPQSRSG